jgi:hypothetical protein
MPKAATRKPQNDYEMHLYQVAHGSAWVTLINSALALKDLAADNGDAGFALREVIAVVEAIGSRAEPVVLRERVPGVSGEYRTIIFELLVGAVLILTEDLAVDPSLLIEALKKMDANELDEMIEARNDASLLPDDAAIKMTAGQLRARGVPFDLDETRPWEIGYLEGIEEHRLEMEQACKSGIKDPAIFPKAKRKVPSE